MSHDKSEEKIEDTSETPSELRMVQLEAAMRVRFPDFQLEGSVLIIKERELQVKDLFLLYSYLEHHEDIGRMELSYNLIEPMWLVEFEKLLSNIFLRPTNPFYFIFCPKKETAPLADHSLLSSPDLTAYIDDATNREFDIETSESSLKVLVKGFSPSSHQSSYRMFLVFSYHQVHQEITTIDLSSCYLDDDWGTFFADLAVPELILADNGIRAAGMGALASNRHLRSLDLTDNVASEMKGSPHSQAIIGHDTAKAFVQNSSLTKLLMNYSCLITNEHEPDDLSSFMAWPSVSTGALNPLKVFQKFIAQGEALKSGFERFDLAANNRGFQAKKRAEAEETIMDITHFSKALVSVLWGYVPGLTAGLSEQEKAERLAAALDQSDNSARAAAKGRYEVLKRQLECICQAVYAHDQKPFFSFQFEPLVDLSSLHSHVRLFKDSPWIRAWNLYAKALLAHPEDFLSRKVFIMKEIMASSDAKPTNTKFAGRNSFLNRQSKKDTGIKATAQKQTEQAVQALQETLAKIDAMPNDDGVVEQNSPALINIRKACKSDYC